MRILYFLTAHDVYSETFIRAEQAHFLGKGHEVYNLALKPKNTLEVFYRIFYFIAAFIKGTSLYRIELPTEEWSGNEENKRLKHWVTQLSLDYFVQKSKAIKPDRFVLHFLFRSSAVGHVLANKLACPYHLRLHTTKSNLNLEWSSAILEGANSISAISEHSRSHFKQKTHNEIKLIRQSLNWRKLESIKPKALQKRSGLLFVGRLVEKKGVKLLIDAYSLIPKEMRDEHALTIIGDGPLEPELRQKIHHLGLTEQVELKGAKEHLYCLEAISSTKILVAPSLKGLEDEDGIPTSLMEAMALCTPVITSDVGGTAEILTEGKAAKLLGTITADALAKAISSLIGDYPEQNEITRSAKEKVTKEYNRTLEIKDL